MKCNRDELIRAGIREGFRNGVSKYANRRCYGYEVTIDGCGDHNGRYDPSVQHQFAG